MVDADRVEDLEFKWGKRRGVGGKKKEITFYQSFTYDGVEYVLYDCVYLFKEGEPEPYIGKLIKIWEKPDKTKKVKVLWFFRPCEIQNYLDVEDTAENELFLASGEGVGLANVNDLEAIAGKCNVVCTSKDSRNPQPSDEELQAADYIFYRTFDVRHCKILDKIEEIVAGIEAKFIFNRLDLQKPGIVLNLDSDKKGVVGHAVASNETEVPCERNLSKEHTTQTTKKVSIDTVGKEHADSNASLAKEEFSLRDKPASIVGAVGEMALSNDKMEKISSNQSKSGSKVKSAEECGELEDRQSKKAKYDIFVKASDDKNEKSVDLDGNDSKALATKTTSDKMDKISSNQTKSGSKVKYAEECGELEDRQSKKAKYDSFDQASDDKNEKSVDLDGNDSKALATKTTSEDKSRLKFVNDSQGAEKQESPLREETASVVGIEIGEMALSNDQMEKISSNQTKSGSEVKSAEEYGELEDRPSKAKSDNFVKVSDDKNEKRVDLDGNDSKASATKTSSEDKSRLKFVNDSQRAETQESSLREKAASVVGIEIGEMALSNDQMEKISSNQTKSGSKVKSAEEYGELEDRSSKKAKYDSFVKASDDKNEKSVDLDGNDSKALATKTTSEDKSRLKFVNDSQGAEKGPSKKLPDKRTELFNGKLLKASPRQSPDLDKKMDHQVMEVTRRPDADRSKWFRGLPWEDRMKAADEQGTLVLLQNLDPAYTSAEVEDIVWHGFNESCAAKMIQRTSISSPHFGQAFVIFKTREAAEMVLRKLDEGCLLLSNGRPLVGRIWNPCFPIKKPTFFGHFTIDKPRHQMLRAMREAVSTSHCSQPNTIEYEMAMEWRLLQERSDISWKKLYKQQGEELRKLVSSFKTK